MAELIYGIGLSVEYSDGTSEQKDLYCIDNPMNVERAHEVRDMLKKSGGFWNIKLYSDPGFNKFV